MLDRLLERLPPGYREFLEGAVQIWLDGGWAMIPIAVIGLVMFGMGGHVWLELSGKGHTRVPERDWRRWIDRPKERQGTIGSLLDRVEGGASLSETTELFGQVRASESAPIERDLLIIKICSSAAPLVGLLGTVTGMLTTFGALASGSGGETAMGMIAAGISEALITTETGLVIALPGVLMHYLLSRQHESYKAFLAHVENVSIQCQHRRLLAAIAPA
jgi:biopolymer transport protein ExbB